MNTYLQNLTALELGLLIASIIIVAVVVYFQFRFSLQQKGELHNLVPFSQISHN